MDFSDRCVLLDIEGTTSSISFVHDEMFPFVRQNLALYLCENWGSESLNESIQLIATDAGYDNWPDPQQEDSEQQLQVIEEVNRQMDEDLKATGLKNLQGKIWKNGFESGALQSHIYEDVKPALESWKSAGVDLRIYSSGSIQAQLLFFGHTVGGNLLELFSAHYDTTIGGKKESDSYAKIAAEVGCLPDQILFVSDILEELDAARQAGLQTALSIRPGNTPIEAEHSHPAIRSFSEIHVV